VARVCPDLTIRSTFIAGFPGETEEEFQTLLDFIAEAERPRGLLCLFPGGRRHGQRPARCAAGRSARRAPCALYGSGRGGLRPPLQRKVGQTLRVLVDEVNQDGGIGRSSADAPEIDGLVYIDPAAKASQRYKTGDFVNVKITGADGHDLWGEVA
jgi:ribosomal protein S12 methylthiotransferase